MANDFAALDSKRRKYFITCLIGAFVVGIVYTWAILQIPFINSLGGNAVQSTVVLCYTLSVILSTMSPSLFGSFIRKAGPRLTIFVGTVILALSYFVSCNTSSMTVFYIAFGFGNGVGSGLIYPTMMGYLATLFPDKRGSVSGTIAGVYGGAAIFWSPVLAYLINSFSLRIAGFFAGVVVLIGILPVAFVVRSMPDEYIAHKASQAKGSGKAGAKTNLPDLNRGQMVKTAMFYVALAAFSFGCTSGMMVISQISSIMQQGYAMTATQAAVYVSLMSFMSMIGRFLWGTVTDHFDKYVTLSIICALPVAAMGVASTAPAQTVTVACLAVVACCYGGFGSTITPITADLFGAKHVTENYGVMYLAFGFAALLGPQLALLLRSGGDFSKAFLVAAVISAVALACALIVRKKVKAALQ